MENFRIKIGGSETYFLYDIPHIYKNIRNSLISSDLIVGDGDIISWEILRKLVDLEDSFVRTAYHLSPRHINPSSFDKLSVKLATQVKTITDSYFVCGE